jgi:hypothetical protein
MTFHNQGIREQLIVIELITEKPRDNAARLLGYSRRELAGYEITGGGRGGRAARSRNRQI